MGPTDDIFKLSKQQYQYATEARTAGRMLSPSTRPNVDWQKVA